MNGTIASTRFIVQKFLWNKFTAGINLDQADRHSRIVRLGLTMQDWELICQAVALTLVDMLAAQSTHLVGRIHVDLGRMRSAICCPSMF
jgi:hypothetical protein